MGMYDVAGWLALGGYYAIEDGLTNHSQKKKLKEVSAIINNLTDEAFEKKIRDEVGNASEDKFDEIWNRIEEFKRDYRHLIHEHLSTSYWLCVGKERFPFTHDSFCKQTNRKRLTKSDEKMIAMYRGWVVTLLMNTYKKYSVAEATRVAFRQVYGIGRDDWTIDFG